FSSRCLDRFRLGSAFIWFSGCLVVMACGVVPWAGYSQKGEIAMAQGKNVDLKVQAGKLVVTIDLSKSYGISASGKSQIVATTAGNVPVPGQEEVKIGLNVYRPQR